MKWYRKGERTKNEAYAVYDTTTDEINIIDKIDYIGLFYDEDSGEMFAKRCGYEGDRFFVDGIQSNDSNLICYVSEMELILDAEKFLKEDAEEVK